MNETQIELVRQKLLSLRSELHKLEESSKEGAKPVDLDQAPLSRLSRRRSEERRVGKDV